MIKITIPNNNIKEREYILDIIFNEFCCLKYTLEYGSKDYEIELGNGSKLTIEDTFFNKFPKDLEYLHVNNIPSKIEELDIFASCFFMLSRWEEYVNKNRDIHNRFPATESLAFKQDFLDRPIVNEYVEILKNMLLELDSNLKFKEYKSQLVLTHDVDHLYLWKNWKQVLRVSLGDILKRRDVFLAFERISEYFLIKREKIKDPFDIFDWLMDKSDAAGIKSKFYLMSGGVTTYDNNYRINEAKSLELIEKIKKRGHAIGIHPSYNAYNDFKQFKKEKDLLEKVTGQKILEGRAHYLRFEVPTTWQIWEDNGMQIDNTCGYADKEGFRCGTGNEFSVFNILTRKQLALKERPLVIMDNTLFDYNAYSYPDAREKIIKLKSSAASFTLLWHNSSIDHVNFYEEICNTLSHNIINTDERDL